MDRRHFVSQPQMSDLGPDLMWNYQHAGPQMNLGDGSSILPSNGMVGLNPGFVSYTSTAVRTGEIPLQNYNSGRMNYMVGNTENSYDSYVCPPSSTSLGRLPPYGVQNGPGYNQSMVRDATAMTNRQLDYGRATYKRKIPSMSDAERGTSSGYYGAGSSSNLTFQGGYVEPKPMVGHGYWTVDPASSEHSYRGNELFSSDDMSQRNVRSRHGNALHLETTSSGVHSSSNMSHHFHPGMNSINPTVPGHWNHNTPAHDRHGVGNCSDLVSSNHEIYHLNRGSYGSNGGTIGNSGPSQPNVAFGRTGRYPLPHPCETSAQSFSAVHNSSNQRTTYRTNYPATGFTPNMQDARVSSSETVMAPRYSRNLSIVGHSNEGNGRARNHAQIFSNSSTVPARWAYEGAATFDRALFGSMNYFDQHSDMRLDIDNMSYEELLALEERIGSVNTGLTEEAMSRGLRESIYCSSNMLQDDADEKNCAICLESYVDRVRLCKLNCRHEFHATCIRKWLSIKNACPICKVSALEDSSKDKQAISM